MTKKDYVAIAAILREMSRAPSLAGVGRVHLLIVQDVLAKAIANYCAECNDQFDRDRFLRACEVC
jgi:hypothetical protein